jgi:CRISPR/Cas system CSM-associated protein Csm3 (group 7 of RAMP superfamily)
MTKFNWTEAQLRGALADSGRRRTHRAVVERWLIEGQLRLETPAHFGVGDAGDYTDMPVLLDQDGRPYLPGASLAGALRNYLREREAGDGRPFPKRDKDIPDPKKDTAYIKAQSYERSLNSTRLFGFYRGDDHHTGAQSPLIVYDAPGHAFSFELRDGVAIDGKTRTAAIEYDERQRPRGKKFDIELLAAGTTFDLKLELVVSLKRPDDTQTEEKEPWVYAAKLAEERDALLGALTAALGGLETGEITLGARKRRGFGRCRVAGWQVRRFDMATLEGLLGWLALGRDDLEKAVDLVAPQPQPIAAALSELLGAPPPSFGDARRRVSLTTTLAVASSLLIRAGFGDESADAPDMAHLHSHRDNGLMPVVPGTSWAGVLRHRAARILNTLAGDDTTSNEVLERLFGPARIEKDQTAYASRLSVRESDVRGGRSLAQTRVRIDRFTGGALESALFDQQPLYGAGSAELDLAIEIRSPAPAPNSAEAIPPVPDHEIGLLLLLLKDLWTGDLRVGGEASVGRGVLRGQSAVLTTPDGTWRFRQTVDDLTIDGPRAKLQGYVDALSEKVNAVKEVSQP